MVEQGAGVYTQADPALQFVGAGILGDRSPLNQPGHHQRSRASPMCVSDRPAVGRQEPEKGGGGLELGCLGWEQI